MWGRKHIPDPGAAWEGTWPLQAHTQRGSLCWAPMTSWGRGPLAFNHCKENPGGIVGWVQNSVRGGRPSPDTHWLHMSNSRRGKPPILEGPQPCIAQSVKMARIYCPTWIKVRRTASWHWKVGWDPWGSLELPGRGLEREGEDPSTTWKGKWPVIRREGGKVLEDNACPQKNPPMMSLWSGPPWSIFG